MGPNYAMEIRDINKIKKLNTLTDPKNFWKGVGKFTRRVTSDHSIGRWQALAEVRYKELVNEDTL